MTPTNDIERLLVNPRFGKQDYPELYRLLRESDLIFLVPNTTGSKGVLPWVDIGQVPPFVVWGSVRSSKRIPIFSSHDAARRACRALGAWNQFAFRQLNGRELFELLAQQDESFVINPACTEFEMHFDASHAQPLADGSMLTPRENKSVEGTLQLLHPKKYPNELVGALLAFFRKNDVIRAAWLLHDVKVKGDETCYVFVLDVSGERDRVNNDFSLIADLACPKKDSWGLQIIDWKNPTLASVPEVFPPFYSVPGYKARA